MRVPLMHGLPNITAGSVEMRACAMSFLIDDTKEIARIEGHNGVSPSVACGLQARVESAPIRAKFLPMTDR